MKTLTKLAAMFRYLQFYAHAAHNVTKGSTFFEDHSFFGDLYGTYEGLYDDMIERLIGLGNSVNIPAITTEACSQFKSAWPSMGGESGAVFGGKALDITIRSNASVDSYSLFSKLLEGESKVRDAIEDCAKSGEVSQGTLNLLADIADKSEMRTYKMQQRVG